jgi:mRNA interferase MazF
MPSTTPYSRGDIVLVAFPFTDLTAAKQRPALVLFARSDTSDVFVVAITSQIPLSLANDEFPIPNNDLVPCGLPKASIVRLTKAVTLHEKLITKKLGRMPAATLQTLLGQFRGLF